MDNEIEVGSESSTRTTRNAEGKDMKIVNVHTEEGNKKKNVAAYARVSTLTEEQQESYETQVEYYSAFIGKNPDWNFVKVYADQGKSGLSVKNRPGFLQMIQDALDGKINIIVTRSISRFARNSLEAKTYVEKLKEKNVEVKFEKENISSFDPQTELLFHFMAAIAQEESRSISENVRWTYTKLADQGIRRLGNNHVLGYNQVNGELIPNEDAWIIRQAFEEYAEGYTLRQIAKHINEKGGRTLHKKNEFRASGIGNLLHNEIYVGDRIIQKKPPVDYLTKKPIVGEYYSYFVENAHTPIVSRELWEKVKARQEAMTKMIEKYGSGSRSGTSMYGRIICGVCGQPMTRRTFSYRKGVKVKAWQCRTKARGAGCKVRSFNENKLFRAIADEAGIKYEGQVTAEMLSGIKEVKVYDGHRIEVAVE